MLNLSMNWMCWKAASTLRMATNKMPTLWHVWRHNETVGKKKRMLKQEWRPINHQLPTELMQQHSIQKKIQQQKEGGTACRNRSTSPLIIHNKTPRPLFQSLKDQQQSTFISQHREPLHQFFLTFGNRHWD